MTNQQLDEIRQRDEKGYSETRRDWSTKQIIDSPAQMASDRHALLAHIDELTRPVVEPEERHCGCIPQMPRTWKYCSDCGGRIIY